MKLQADPMKVHFIRSGERRYSMRIERADVAGPNGARIRVGGRDGVTYYWPTGRIRSRGRSGSST